MDRASFPDWVYGHDLTWSLLEQYPVWGEFLEDESDVIRAITLDDPFALDGVNLTVTANFITKEGLGLHGSVDVVRQSPYYDVTIEGVEADEVRSMDFLFGDHFFTFSCILPSFTEKHLNRLRDYLGMQQLEIFPVWYDTHLTKPDGTKLAGYFTPYQNHPLAIDSPKAAGD